jgi:L-fuconolactonase
VEIIDAQVHLWERNPERSLDTEFAGSAGVHAQTAIADYRQWQVTPLDMLAAMEETGVNAAVVVTPSIAYGFDNSYAFEAAAKHPGKFGVVGPIDPTLDDLDELVKSWRSRPGALGLRVVILSDRDRAKLQGGFYSRVFASAQKHSVPVCIFCSSHVGDLQTVAGSYADVQLIIDHLGLPITTDVSPWKELQDLLALAAFPNIALKLTALPLHSREKFPFSDLWPPLHRIIERFGMRRIMWGSDWTRVRRVVSYDQSLRYITDTSELSAADKEQLLSKSLRRIFRWNPPQDAPTRPREPNP